MKKKIFFFALITSLSFSAIAQQLRIQSGRNISIFYYKNSKGEKLPNLNAGNNFCFSTSYRTLMYHSPFHFSGGFSYNRYSANGSDTILNNSYSWQTNYLAIDVSSDINFIEKKIDFGIHERNFTVSFKTAISTEFLIKGTQDLNGKIINLIGVEEFNRPFLFARAGLTANYYVNNDIGIFVEYLGGRSWIIDKDKSDLESLNFITNTLYVGLTFSLPN